ncbi:N-formylglutamate deformylase [Rubellimicrobium roseum]|uniref:N-formylglutamate deformylase n=1 Tax=Rubellimicrobium roseum TaxID=687525 RepID=A0A5C4NHE9_9RHOB|nr:N-formylglutamate deformylase [Rubellimicrobium roseum]TNC74244.1 N-formylglutamate deformylase [Rubellimicrobium roseum]
MEPVVVRRGAGPLILSLPHVGTHLPPAVADRLNDEGRVLRDTDWHVDALYEGLLPKVTVVAATHHRYVIDLNRDPAGGSLYPGQTTTGLIPEATFDDVPIWQPGQEPAEADRALWRERVHRPYHAALAAEIVRVRESLGVAILYDCHSIRSEIPWLFPGVLPDLNIGTDGGRTCAPALEETVVAVARASGRSWVLNGRFRGGWTVRHHGRPSEGVHAIQMELAQASHLAAESPPFALDPEKAAALRPVLTGILSAIVALAPSLART